MTWQAILDESGRVVTVNNWEHSVGIPCDQFTPIGHLWTGSGFIEHPDDAAKRLREQAKAARQQAVDSIKVTTSTGKTFDGDEISQTRMARAIIALQAAGAPSVTWVLADNTAIEATLAELKEALALAGAEQARLWVI